MNASDVTSAVVPLLAITFCWVYLFLRLNRAKNRVVLADVGLVFASFVYLYALMPLLGSIFSNSASDFTDNRLRGYDPSTYEVGMFMWNYVGFLGGFVALYSWVWRKEFLIANNIANIRQFEAGVAVLVVVLSMYFNILNILGGVVTGASYDDSFFDNYQRNLDLPLILQQLTSRLSGILLVAKIALVLIVVRNLRYPLWRLFGYCWVIYEIARPFVELGARSGSFFVLLTFIFCYHNLIKPITIRSLVIGMVVLFTGYLVQGILRSGADYGQFGLIEAGLAGNEFQSIFATAFDIKIRMESGNQEIPWQIYFSDFLRLIPQQLVAFEKMDAAEWYLDIIGYKGTGVGFGFSAISEGLVGFGFPELIIRGAVLGCVLGWIHNAACKHTERFYWIIFYMWLCTRIYLSFRNSTFFWLSSIVYEFLPTIILLSIMRSGKRHDSHVHSRDQPA